MKTIKCDNCINTFRLDTKGKELVSNAKAKGASAIKCLNCGEFGFKLVMVDEL